MKFSLFAQKKRNELKEKRQQLYRVAYSWCNDELLADDLVNETLYKAMNKLGDLRDQSQINSWLFKIMSNCWHDHLRKLKPQDDIDDVVIFDNDTPEQLLHQQEIILQVRRAVSLLPMGQRQVVTLVDLEGFSYDEVSAILSIPMGTVMSRLNRARISLKEKLLQKTVMQNKYSGPNERSGAQNNEFQKGKLRSIK